MERRGRKEYVVRVGRKEKGGEGQEREIDRKRQNRRTGNRTRERKEEAEEREMEEQ